MERDEDRPSPRDEEIRRRAYELYEARGGADGDDVADWLAAERELAERRTAGPEELGEPPREDDPEDAR